MQIFLTRAAGPMAGQKLTLEVQSGWTVDRLKKYLEDEHGVRCIKQRIIVEGVHMVGARTLADYGIGLETDLKLVERPPAALSDEQGAVDEALTHLHSMSDGLRRRWEEVSAAAQALEDEKAALLQANSGGAKLKKKLKLNVGGTEYKGVKRETLCAVPESHLAQLFSGRWEQCLLRDSSGNIFLDIDPACFDKILAFLVELKQRPGEPAGAPPPLPLQGCERCCRPVLDCLLLFCSCQRGAASRSRRSGGARAGPAPPSRVLRTRPPVCRPRRRGGRATGGGGRARAGARRR
eukprot:COSAG02_NODE_12_length_58022_cov_242.077379_33_plen_293_part_00